MPIVILVILILSSLMAHSQTEVSLLTSRRLALNSRHDVLVNGPTGTRRYKTFLFAIDETGKNLLGSMVESARQGNKVLLLVDGMSAELAKNHAFLQAASELGVEVKIFSPIYRNPFQIGLRNHQKYASNEIEAVLGGRNSEDHYFDEIIDMESKIKGDEVSKANAAFDEIYNSSRSQKPFGFASRQAIDSAKEELLKRADASRARAKAYAATRKELRTVENVKYYADPSNILKKRKEGISKPIYAMIDEAKVSIKFANPYPYMPPELVKKLKAAIDRGVKVELITNAAATSAKKDFSLATMAWDVIKDDLIKMGVEVHESSRYIHSKTIIVDGSKTFIGSFNHDMRSLLLNLENGIIVTGKSFATALDNHNRRIKKVFTTKVEPRSKANLPPMQKAASCAKDGLRRLVVNMFYRHL